MRCAKGGNCDFAVRVAACAVALMLTGCFARTYEERLEESRKYYAYLDKLNANLAPAFKEGPIEELRVPLQFRAVPKPAPVKNESGEVVPPDFDPRQPNDLLIEFKGLIATWEASFDIVTSAGPQRKKGYIYALSNAAMLGAGDAEQAADFYIQLLDQLAQALRVPQLDRTHFDSEEYPRSRTYTPPKKFEVYRFGVDVVSIDDVPHTIEVYVHRLGELQVVLVVMLPVGIDPSKEKLAERLPLMLERLKVSAKRQPAGKKAGPAGPAAPAGAAPAAKTGF